MAVDNHNGTPAHELTAQGLSTQAQCDVIQAEFRANGAVRRSIRRDPPPRPPALIPTDDLLRLRLAEELQYTRRMLDAMGDDLSADAGVVMRHMVAMQSIDIIGQLLGHVADVIRSSDPIGAVENIGMCELKGRLTRSSID